MTVSDILEARMRKSLPSTQDDAIRYAVRQAIATLGVMPDYLVKGACLGLTMGLFGEAWDKADGATRLRWYRRVTRRYRQAVGGRHEHR